MSIIDKAVNFIWNKCSFFSNNFSQKEGKELIVIIFILATIFAIPLTWVAITREEVTPYKVEIVNLDQLKICK